MLSGRRGISSSKTKGEDRDRPSKYTKRGSKRRRERQYRRKNTLRKRRAGGFRKLTPNASYYREKQWRDDFVKTIPQAEFDRETRPSGLNGEENRVKNGQKSSHRLRKSHQKKLGSSRGGNSKTRPRRKKKIFKRRVACGKTARRGHRLKIRWVKPKRERKESYAKQGILDRELDRNSRNVKTRKGSNGRVTMAAKRATGRGKHWIGRVRWDAAERFWGKPYGEKSGRRSSVETLN